MFLNYHNNRYQYQYFPLLLIIFSIIVLFCKVTLQYVYDRYRERKSLINIDNDNDDDDDDDDNRQLSNSYYDVEQWLKQNGKSIQRENYNNNNNNNQDNSLCKEMVIEVDNKDTCKDISRKLCDGNVMLKKITVPSNSKIDFYSHSGVKLLNGKSYCIYKPPPFFNDSDNGGCNEAWGFWQYSLKNERWQCKSKVPGIYNADKNIFDPCSKGKGLLHYKNKLLHIENISKYFTPEQFFNEEFQKRFKCECPPGYVFRKDLSRTTCFKDPCLADLPRYAQASGYDIETGNCLCSPFFTNLKNNNPKYPCTACPEAPSWDPTTKILTLFIKCSRNFPCK